LVPCMDAWCKISPCKCRDGINALIAERDNLQDEINTILEIKDKQVNALLAERDKLKAVVREHRDAHDYDAEKICNLETENAALVERVGVLEGALEQYANMEKEGDPPCWRGTPYLARAALRTSEEAKA
jgi:hypothetical protein